MAYAESDVTYCSEAERDYSSQPRRSQRLLHRSPKKFSDNVNLPPQRLEEIYQSLKNGKMNSNRTRREWENLKADIDMLKKLYRRFSKSKLEFIQKRIDLHLEEPKTIFQENNKLNDSAAEDSENDKNSPNILAGMTTETAMDIPLHQENVPENVINHQPKESITQAHALDLTRKEEKPAQNSPTAETKVEILKASEQKKEFHTNSLQNISKEKPKKIRPLVALKDVTIDLTRDKESVVTKNRNLNGDVMQSGSQQRVSKWLKYLPSQQKPKIWYDNSKMLSQTKKSENTFKETFSQLGKDIRPAMRVSNKSKVTNQKSNLNQHKKNVAIPESRLKAKKQTCAKDQRTHMNNPDRSDFHVQNVAGLSPNFLAEDLIPLELLALNDCESVASLSISIKDGFRRVFGTDSLNEVLGCEKIIYSLTDIHVKRLAIALKIKEADLRATIEKVLVDDNDDAELEKNTEESSSSAVDCSRSPTPRLFPSQKSQISK